MPKIILNEAERRVAKFVALERNKMNEAKDTPDKIEGLHTTPEQYIKAVGAEVAFCKWANVFPDLGFVPGHWDAVLPDGRTVEVRDPMASVKPGLHCNPMRICRADLYCMVEGGPVEYEIVGFCEDHVLLGSPDKNKRGEFYSLKKNDKRMKGMDLLYSNNGGPWRLLWIKT